MFDLNMKNKFHEIYNLGTGKTYSILKISQIIGKLLNIRFKIKLKKHHPTDMTFTKSNMKKSRKYLKYNPKINLEIGLKNYLRWHLKHRNNQNNNFIRF